MSKTADPARRYDLIVFDWDGTLMDTAANIIRSLQKVATDFDLPVPTPESIREVVGLGPIEVLGRLFPNQEISTYEDLYRAYGPYYLAGEKAHTEFYEGALDVLNTLHQAGYTLAVATGKSRRGLDRALEEASITELFSATRTACESLSKPHPKMLNDILEELMVAPERALMIGDTEYDVELAHNAGVDALAVSYGNHSEARLLASKPLACLHDVREIPTWLAGHN